MIPFNKIKLFPWEGKGRFADALASFCPNLKSLVNFSTHFFFILRENLNIMQDWWAWATTTMDSEITRRAGSHGCRMFACTFIHTSTSLADVYGATSQRYLVHHSDGTLSIFGPVFYAALLFIWLRTIDSASQTCHFIRGWKYQGNIKPLCIFL